MSKQRSKDIASYFPFHTNHNSLKVNTLFFGAWLHLWASSVDLVEFTEPPSSAPMRPALFLWRHIPSPSHHLWSQKWKLLCHREWEKKQMLEHQRTRADGGRNIGKGKSRRIFKNNEEERGGTENRWREGKRDLHEMEKMCYSQTCCQMPTCTFLLYVEVNEQRWVKIKQPWELFIRLSECGNEEKLWGWMCVSLEV